MNIFAGKTISPVREYIADLIHKSKPKRIIMPCAGSFAVCFLLNEEERKKTYCSDINLYSNIIGYTADESVESVSEKIGLKITGKDLTDDLDILTEAMFRMSLNQIKENNEYGINKKKSMLMEEQEIKEQIRDNLLNCKSRLSGIHYEIADFRKVAQDLKKGDFLYVNPPTYRGGYEKMFIYDGIEWNEPEIEFFDDKEYVDLVTKMLNSDATVVIYSQKKVKVQDANVIYAQYMGGGRTDYIISNKTFDGTFLVVYVGDFREDTYEDCLKKWLKQYGYYKR